MQTFKKNWLPIVVLVIIAGSVIAGIYLWPGSFDEKAGVAQNVRSAALADRYKGYILLDSGDQNKAWYIYPVNGRRYFLGQPERGLQMMRRLGAVIGSGELAKVPIADSGEQGDLALRQTRSGFVLKHGADTWYVNPRNLSRYYLNTPEDLAHLISRFGITVKTSDLVLIPLAVENKNTYARRNIQTNRGTFLIDLVTIDLSQNNIGVVTATASKSDCYNNCPARPLQDFVLAANGFVGIHGAYFCPPDYASCQSKINYYFFPFYEVSNGFLVNAGQVKWLQGSILVFDQNNNHYFFVDGRDFKSVTAFELKYNAKIQALASNSPALIAAGQNIVATQKMDDKQRSVKGYRGGIGIRGKVVYLVIARGATVPDMASIMEALGVQTALNLDGGGSSALYWKGQYKVGPGRLLPTAIIFKEK